MALAIVSIKHHKKACLIERHALYFCEDKMLFVVFKIVVFFNVQQ